MKDDHIFFFNKPKDYYKVFVPTLYKELFKPISLKYTF
jgi:hypothetical protein